MSRASHSFTVVALLAGACLVAPISDANAAQILFDHDCTFSAHVPGLFGGTKLDYHVERGALFEEDSEHKYCGPTTSSTPFGPASETRCVGTQGGKVNSLGGTLGSLDDFAGSDCTVADAALLTTAFNANDSAPWSGAGKSTLRGQAFLKTVGGDVKTCAGESVALVPTNPYFDELLEKWRVGVSVNPDPRALATVRHSICDAQGNFTFTSLPTQRWYVLTSVTWGVPHIAGPGEDAGPLASALFGIPPAPTTDEQGGPLLQAVALQLGDNQVYLTDRDRR